MEQDSVVSSYRNKSSSTVAANGLKKANLGRYVADMRIKYTEHPVVEPSHNSNVSSVEIYVGFVFDLGQCCTLCGDVN